MKKLAAIILAFSLTGCSLSKALMPYHEYPLCQRGAETGYCGSITAVYRQSLKDEERGGMKAEGRGMKDEDQGKGGERCGCKSER